MTLKVIRIGDLGRIVTGDTPLKSRSEFYGSAYPFIKPTDMKVGQRFTFAYDECYSDEAFEKYRKKLIPTGSTAVVTIGSIGQKLTLTHTPCFVNQAVNAVVPDPLRFDSVYVYYLLRHNLQLVKSADTGASSGRENVSKSNFSGIELLACLDFDEQKRIAKVLNSYDSLIEINQKRVALLEETARLIYREWFVHFRFPGHAAARAESCTPPGWEMGAIGDLALFLNRGITPTYDDAASGIVINQKCIRGGRLNLTPARKQSKVVKPERQIQIGDVLINSTGAGTLGRVAQVRTSIPNCTVDTHVTIVRPSDGKSAAYLGVALLELESVLSTMGIGSTNQLELGRADIAGLSMFVPPLAMREEFHELVWPLFMQAETLAQTNERLTEARDALLPKLMSGEIQV